MVIELANAGIPKIMAQTTNPFSPVALSNATNFSFSYNLNQTSFVILQATCLTYPCWIINLPPNCVLETPITSVSPWYLCNETAGTYTVKGMLFTNSTFELIEPLPYELNGYNATTQVLNISMIKGPVYIRELSTQASGTTPITPPTIPTIYTIVPTTTSSTTSTTTTTTVETTPTTVNTPPAPPQSQPPAPTTPRACILGSDMVYLYNGSKILASNIKVGDYVYSYNVSNMTIVPARVTFVEHNTAPLIEFINGNFGVTPTDQPLYVKNNYGEGWLRNPIDLKVGDYLYLPLNNTWIRVNSISYEHGKYETVDIYTSGFNNFVANGYLADSKLTLATVSPPQYTTESLGNGVAVSIPEQPSSV
ncbi:MAG: Hint domain-containing protein [Candidatus Micrarchaeia archaeon]